MPGITCLRLVLRLVFSSSSFTFYKFYNFYNDDKINTPIVIDVQAFGNCDPDIYIVQGKNNRPTTSKF